MRVLFLVPPYRTTDVLTAQLYPMPYAAALLAAKVRAERPSWTVAIKDFLLPATSHGGIAAPESFAGLHAPPYLHYGTPLHEALLWLTEHRREFDVVALCTQQAPLFETVQALARHVRDLGLPLVAGGAFATTAPEECARRVRPNVLVRGEAEEVVVTALEQAANGGDELVMRGEPVDITAQPLPAWDLAPPTAYPKFGSRHRGVLCISRGCPWDCAFCSVWTVMGRNHRRQGRARIREELLHLFRAGVRYFSFLDDNLFVSRKAVDELLSVLGELRDDTPGFSGCRFYVEEGIEVRMAAEPGLLKRIADAGFDNLGLGVETVNGARLKAARKPYKPEQLRAAVAEVEQAGLVPRAFYIVGFPGDTVESVCRDLVEFGRLGFAARPNNLKLYPGTDITAEFQKQGWAPADFDWRLSTFFTPTSTGPDYATLRRLKTILGAIGFAAEAFGVKLFADPLPVVQAKLAGRRYQLEVSTQRIKGAPASLSLRGNIFRATPYRRMLEMLLLAAGAPGATSEVGKNHVSAAWSLSAQGDVQRGIVAALRAPQEEARADA